MAGCTTDNKVVQNESSTDELYNVTTEQMSVSEVSTETMTEKFAEYNYFNHKSSISEDENNIYTLDSASHMLIVINKKTNEISYLCSKDGCKHEQNSACDAFVESDSALSADIWIFQNKIYFMSGKKQYALECIDLKTRNREKILTIESDAVTDFWFFDGNLFYIQKIEDNDYCLIKAGISGEPETAASLKQNGENLKVKDSSFYFLSEGKLYAGTFSESELKEIAEQVYDYDIGEQYIYYSVSGEGVWQYDLLTEEKKIFSDMELRAGYDFAVFACGNHVLAYNTKAGLYYMDGGGKVVNHVNEMKYNPFYNVGISENYFIYVGHSEATEISYIRLNELETAENFIICR